MVLSYDQIPKYFEIVDRSKQNSVRLTKRQYALFKKLNRKDIGLLRGIDSKDFNNYPSVTSR